MDIRNQLIRLRLHPFFLDILTTGMAQAAVLAANLILVGRVSKSMGVAVLGEYLLVRRISSWLLLGSQLGLGVALPRQIAYIAEDIGARAKQYLVAGLATALLFVGTVGTVAALNAQRVAQWCFGSDNRKLVFALVLLLLGSAAHSMVFGYFRGLQRVQMANLVAFGGLAVVPLLALAVTYTSHSAPTLIGATGIGLGVVSILWAAPNIATAQHLNLHFFNDVRRLLGYGVARVPGDLAVGGLLAVGPMLVSHYASIEQLSYLLLGGTCLTMAGMAFSPLGIVLLAKISRLLGAGRLQEVNEYIGHLRSAVLQVSIVVVMQALIFSQPIVLWWLGPSCIAGVPVICIVLLAVPGYMYFLAMRSVVDAASNIAYNARNLLITLAVLIALSVVIVRYFPRPWIVIGVAAATAVACYVLAFLTHWTLHTLKLSDWSPQGGLIWMVPLLGAINLTAQWAFHFEITKPAFALVVLVNLGLILLLLYKSQPEWVGFVRRVAFART